MSTVALSAAGGSYMAVVNEESITINPLTKGFEGKERTTISLNGREITFQSGNTQSGHLYALRQKIQEIEDLAGQYFIAVTPSKVVDGTKYEFVAQIYPIESIGSKTNVVVVPVLFILVRDTDRNEQIFLILPKKDGNTVHLPSLPKKGALIQQASDEINQVFVGKGGITSVESGKGTLAWQGGFYEVTVLPVDEWTFEEDPTVYQPVVFCVWARSVVFNQQDNKLCVKKFKAFPVTKNLNSVAVNRAVLMNDKEWAILGDVYEIAKTRLPVSSNPITKFCRNVADLVTSYVEDLEEE